MCFFFSFMPATVWLVIGYFILFASTRAEGAVGTLGRVLSIWAFLLSLLIVLAGVYVTWTGLCPMAELMQSPGG